MKKVIQNPVNVFEVNTNSQFLSFTAERPKDFVGKRYYGWSRSHENIFSHIKLPPEFKEVKKNSWLTHSEYEYCQLGVPVVGIGEDSTRPSFHQLFGFLRDSEAGIVMGTYRMRPASREELSMNEEEREKYFEILRERLSRNCII